MTYLTVVPCYGRDYKSKAKAIADWHAGKDFRISNYFDPYDGKPVNMIATNVLKEQGYKGIQIRYKKLMHIALVEF